MKNTIFTNETKQNHFRKSLVSLLFITIFVFIIPIDLQAQEPRPGEVILYKDGNFKGERYSISLNNNNVNKMPNLTNYFGNDNISSVKVGKGVKLMLWDDIGCNEYYDSLILCEGNFNYLLDWNDRITSLALYKVDDRLPMAKFYVDDNLSQSNPYQSLQPGKYNDGTLLIRDGFDQVDIPNDLMVKVYQDANFRGYSQTIVGGGRQRLSDWGMKDNISSIEITQIASTPVVSYSQLPLASGQELIVGKKYYSRDRKYYLEFGSDGNLVIRPAAGGFVWGSHNNKNAPLNAKYARMQTDGNLCLYDSNNKWLWGTQTTVPNSTANVNHKGELVILDPYGNEIWNGNR